MSEKLHNILRFLQWFVPALATFYGVLDKAFGWELMPIVEHDSASFFADKEIVEKENEVLG